MSIKKIYLCIMACIISNSVYTAEKIALEHNPHNSPLYHILELPKECLDLIIFRNQPETIGAFKLSCKKICKLASLMRINKGAAHRCTFDLNDDAIKEKFFKRISQFDNPQYIKTIIKYGKKQALSNMQPPNSTIIIIDESIAQTEYLDEHYLPFLLEYSIENGSVKNINHLIKHGATKIKSNQSPLEYATQYKQDEVVKILLGLKITTEKNIKDALRIAKRNQVQSIISLLENKQEKLISIEKCQYYLRISSCMIFILGLSTTGIYLACKFPG